MANVLMNGGKTTEVNTVNFMDFLNKGLVVEARLQPGEYQATWLGLDIDISEGILFTFKFKVADMDYKFKVKVPTALTKEQADRITWSFQDLARQLDMTGNVQYADYNQHIGKPITVWAVQVEGKGGTFYNFRAPKQTTIIATETTVSDGKDF